VPNLSHLWQRLLRATALVFGLAVGVAVTVFAYSNTATVNVGWATLHLSSVPLWTVAVVPLVIVLAAGAVYHWANNLHHFTEHMKHRRRVKELEAELASLKSHLDTALEMPDHDEVGTAAVKSPEEVEPDEPVRASEAARPNGEDKVVKKDRKRPTVLSDTEAVAVTDSEAKPEETPAEP
jgi:uncharacterized integral membrane protein